MKPHVLFAAAAVGLGSLTGLAVVWPMAGVLAGIFGTAAAGVAAVFLREGE